MANVEQINHLTSHEARDMVQALADAFGSELILQIIAQRVRDTNDRFHVSPDEAERVWVWLRGILTPWPPGCVEALRVYGCVVGNTRTRLSMFNLKDDEGELMPNQKLMESVNGCAGWSAEKGDADAHI